MSSWEIHIWLAFQYTSFNCALEQHDATTIRERIKMANGMVLEIADLPNDQFRCSIVVSISARHAEDPGSIPGGGVFAPGCIAVKQCKIDNSHLNLYQLGRQGSFAWALHFQFEMKATPVGFEPTHGSCMHCAIGCKANVPTRNRTWVSAATTRCPNH